MSDQHAPQQETPENEGPSRGRMFFEELVGLNVDLRSAVLVPILAIITALIVGALIILFTDIQLWRGEVSLGDSLAEIGNAYKALALGSFGSIRAISETLVASAPLILGGLSVAIGFRAGLFNIGTEGQILMGGMFGLIVGTRMDIPVLGMIAGVLFGFLGGAIWGAIPGLLRARTGAHEVITTIMLNNIAIFLVNWLLKTSFFQAEGRDDPVSAEVVGNARLPRLLAFLDRSDVRVHAGIIVALLAAYGIYWLLFRSTIGYEFRAVGANPDAARYAGMSVTWIYVAVMAVAGGLGGLAGASQINGLLYRATPGFSAGIGFEAISLALLGRSHPAGVVLAGLLFGALRAGGQEMQVDTAIPIDLILVIQALVVVFIAAPALIRAIYRVRTGEGAGQLTTGWAT